MESSKHGLRRRGRIWKKLHTSRGASMIFALAVFMLCILTGTAALTAASGNMGRYTHLEGEQQQYLSVASALELLSGQMKPVSVKVQYVVKEEWEYVAGAADPACVYTYELKLVDPAVLPASLNFYQKMLLVNCVPDAWYTNTTGLPGALKEPLVTDLVAGDKTYTIRLSSAHDSESWADTLYPVKAKVNYGVKNAGGAVVTNDYTLEMHLYADLSNPANLDLTEKPYPIRVVWPGAVSTDSEETVVTSGDLTGVFSRNPGAEGTRTTTTILTCKLEWPVENRVITFE